MLQSTSMNQVLTASERALLVRQIRRRKLSLFFSVASVAVAAVLLAVYAFKHLLNPARGVILLLILIGAKNHLRIYRLAGILEKLAGAGPSGPGRPTS